MMMRLMIRCRPLIRIERYCTFGSYCDPPSSCHRPSSITGSIKKSPRLPLLLQHHRPLTPTGSMINSRHLILSSHRREITSSQNRSGQRMTASLKRHSPSHGNQQQQLHQQVRRTQSLGSGPTSTTTTAAAATASNIQRMQFLRSAVILCHPLFRGSDYSISEKMGPSAIPHSPPLLMVKDPKSQSSYKRNKSSSSSSFSTRSASTKTGPTGESTHRSSSLWLQGRMRLFLFSFLCAFVPVLMHFRKRSQNQDTAKWHAKKDRDGSSMTDSGYHSDTSSTVSSVNESSDESAVQVTYQQILASEVEVLFFKLLPLKLISRIWGWINSLPLPEFVRVRIISWYSRVFECDLTEADKQDLRDYANLGDFFKRQLKPGCRPIDGIGEVVSPSDGTVVHFGQIDEQHVEQVKGVKYSLAAFLGPQSWVKESTNKHGKQENEKDNQEYHQKLISRPGNALYHCVIYLAPGDYHRFHSPADWTVRFRRHFSGKLISIRPTFMSWISDLFTINERVAYIGKWAHGFFSMTAVGATNVGSVRVYFDEKLRTNRFLSFPGSFTDQGIQSITKARGDAFGEFNLGSTIVLIFEAPADLECAVRPGSKIRYGQKLFSINRNKG